MSRNKMNKVCKTAIRVIAMIAASLLVACMLTMLVGCAPAENGTSENSTVGEASDAKSDYAILRLPDDTIIQGHVDRRYSFTNGCVEITIDGVEYLTHWANVVIIESSK